MKILLWFYFDFCGNWNTASNINLFQEQIYFPIFFENAGCDIQSHPDRVDLFWYQLRVEWPIAISQKKKKKKKKEKIIKNNLKKWNKFFYFQTKNRVQKMKLKMYIGPLLPKSQPRPNFQKIFVDPLTNIRRPWGHIWHLIDLKFLPNVTESCCYQYW